MKDLIPTNRGLEPELGGEPIQVFPVVIFLPGIMKTGSLYDAKGILDRKSALEYYNKKGFPEANLHVINHASNSGNQDAEILKCIAKYSDEMIFECFSGGISSMRRVWPKISKEDRARINVIGSGIAFKNAPNASSFPGAKSFKEVKDIGRHFDHYKDLIKKEFGNV